MAVEATALVLIGIGQGHHNLGQWHLIVTEDGHDPSTLAKILTALANMITLTE